MVTIISVFAMEALFYYKGLYGVVKWLVLDIKLRKFFELREKAL